MGKYKLCRRRRICHSDWQSAALVVNLRGELARAQAQLKLPSRAPTKVDTECYSAAPLLLLDGLLFAFHRNAFRRANGEHVADAAFGTNVMRVMRIGFQLAAQTMHMHTQRIFVDFF